MMTRDIIPGMCLPYINYPERSRGVIPKKQLFLINPSIKSGLFWLGVYFPGISSRVISGLPFDFAQGVILYPEISTSPQEIRISFA